MSPQYHTSAHSSIWFRSILNRIIHSTKNSLTPRRLIAQLPFIHTSDTLAWRGMPRYLKPNSPVALVILPVLNQSSNQKKVDSPLFTSLLINIKASGRSLSNLHKSHKPLFESFASQNDPPPKISAPTQATQREPDKENNRHIRSKAKTIDVSLSFRIPKPPSHLGEHLASQTTKTHCKVFQFHPNKILAE